MSNKDFIQLLSVSKSYLMGEIVVKALNDFSISIQKGETVVFVGPSGSGKTTLLNMIGGLDSPSNGDIYINGKNIANFNRKKLTHYRKNSIGFVFQFFNLIPNLNARENIEFAIELVGVQNNHNLKPSFNKNHIRNKSIELLSTVGLSERAEHFPYQLSGGEQQRVAIARALAKDPQIIIADEPTGNLDNISARKVLQVMYNLAKKSDKTVLIVTHNSAIAKTAERVIRLSNGNISDDYINSSPLSIEQLDW